MLRLSCIISVTILILRGLSPIITPILQMRKLGLSSLDDIHEATKLESDRPGTQPQDCLIPSWTIVPLKLSAGTSLVVQWLRIQLPMQGTWVQTLVRELGSQMPQGH